MLRREAVISAVCLNTGDPVLAVPADITAYDKMVFSLSFSGLITGTAACELDITLSGGSSGASYGLLSGFAPSFQEYSVPLEDFYISNGTLADLKSALDKVQMYITLQGGENSAADYQFYLDNIRFE